MTCSAQTHQKGYIEPTRMLIAMLWEERGPKVQFRLRAAQQVLGHIYCRMLRCTH